MARIISVVRTWGRYGVVYDTGLRRSYSAENLPKTVRAWLDANQIQEEPEPEPEPEKIDLDDDSQTAYLDLYATWHEPDLEAKPERSNDEAVEIILPSLIENPEYHDTPIPPRKPENPPKDLPTPSKGSPNQGSYRRASEAVAFGICMAFAILAHGLIELVSLLAIMIDTGWTLAKPKARAGCILLARWLAAKAKAMAYSLPDVTTWRGLLVAVRALPILVGLIALT